MPVERARSIQEVSEAVAGAEVVLTSDAPLALALDRRVSEPRLGRAAATPRSHVSHEVALQDRRGLFFELVETSGLPWKTAARSLDLCLDCWDRTGSREAILSYSEFDEPAIRSTVELLGDAESSYRALAEAELSCESDIRVIDEGSFTALDRTILPDDGYEVVEPFGAGEASVPDVHLYPSATAIVDAVLEHVSAAVADQVGVVLDQRTVYGPLLEAAFDAHGIPYEGGPGFIDDDTVRVFLRVLQTCFAGSTLTAAEVRPLLTSAGWSIPRSLDEQRVDVSAFANDHAAFEQLEAVRSAARSGTFGDALAAFESLLGQPVPTLEAELGELGLASLAVTERRVNELVYYLQSFEVPVDRESRGVLLTDARSTAYVDRPVVFYLGLGEGWASTPPEYPWVDEVESTERDLSRFTRLLQNGDQRYILAQNARAGDTVTPCPYLRTILDGAFETFSDLPDATSHGARDTGRGPPAFDVESDPGEPEPVEAISQSSLTDLVVSPRDYYFDQLLESPTNYYMQRGTVLHEAAELYVNAPDWFTTDTRRTELLDEMLAQLGPFVSDTRQPLIRTRLDVGLDVVEAYLSANDPVHAEYDTYGRPFLDNDLADALGVSIDAHICERWFHSADLGGRGVVDLIQDPQTIVDYKTGSVSSAREIQQRAAIEEVHDYPDFQVLLYLAQHRRERPDERLQMRFVHLLGDVHAMVKGSDADLEELVTTLTYVPCSFPEFVARRPMYDELTDYADSNDRCRVLDALGYDRYREFFDTHQLPRDGVAPDQRASIQEAFLELAREVVGDHKYVQNGVELIFGDLTEPPGYFLDDDLDAFEAFLQDRLADLADYRRSRFPVSIDDEEPNWDRVDHRDCILTTDD